VDYSQVAAFDLFVGNLPAGESVTCYLSPIRALPLVDTVLTNPSLTVGGSTLTLPTAIPPGCFLEFLSGDDCKLYGKEGELLQVVTPEGSVPQVVAGENEVRLTCAAATDQAARARVTLFSQGERLR
jgi:hypothetical protein